MYKENFIKTIEKRLGWPKNNYIKKLFLPKILKITTIGLFIRFPYARILWFFKTQDSLKKILYLKKCLFSTYWELVDSYSIFCCFVYLNIKCRSKTAHFFVKKKNGHEV